MTGPAEHAFPWEPWGEAAFARARAEGKPVVLHIGATWCHWCHVMDDGTYTHPGVARLLRDSFVAVRVDTDERPDVNERYNQGGWPTLAVLDAEGEVLYGRTYLTAAELYGILAGLATSEARWTIAPSRPAIQEGPPVAIERVAEEVRRAFDRYYGGFGDVEKFPHTQVGSWLLDRHLRTGDEEAWAMLAPTLDGMAGRGMYDAEEGGFFRYATQDDWREPHYEKLLDDHARLLPLYLRASAVDPRPLWREASRAAVAWALHTLWDDGAGAFRASQDADEAYYARPRGSRGEPPPVDPTLYAGWNGAMAAALVRAGAAWRRPGLTGIARRIGHFLRGRVAPDGRVARAGDVSGLLDDQVGAAEGFLALAAALGADPWLADATRVLDWAHRSLAASQGGYLDRIPEGVGRLRVAARPLHGNARFAHAAATLAALTGDEGWAERARAAATAALVEAEGWGFMGAAAAAAAERVARLTVTVKVHAAPGLLDAAVAAAHPDVCAILVDATTAAREGVPPGTAVACSERACARPAETPEALARSLAQLLRA